MDEILRLGEILKEKGMTQQDLADKLEISKVYVSELARNVKFPRKEMLIKLSQALDVDVRELLVSTKSKDLSDPLEAFKEIKRIVDRVKD